MKMKNRSVSQREQRMWLLFWWLRIVVLLSSSNLPIWGGKRERKRDEERNLMMSLTVRRIENDVFVTTTARNNDKSVYCIVFLSFSRLLLPLLILLRLFDSLSSKRCEMTTYVHFAFLPSVVWSSFVLAFEKGFVFFLLVVNLVHKWIIEYVLLTIFDHRRP